MSVISHGVTLARWFSLFELWQRDSLADKPWTMALPWVWETDLSNRRYHFSPQSQTSSIMVPGHVYITNQKYGANALGIQRVLELGSYHTAWEWLHRLRRTMVRPGRERLSGCVQVDETYIGGPKAGKRGRGATGKTLVAIAVEDLSPNGIGRIRLGVVPDASRNSLTDFVIKHIDPGSTIQTDDWSGYADLPGEGYQWEVLPSEQMKLPHLVLIRN